MYQYWYREIREQYEFWEALGWFDYWRQHYVTVDTVEESPCEQRKFANLNNYRHCAQILPYSIITPDMGFYNPSAFMPKGSSQLMWHYVSYLFLFLIFFWLTVSVWQYMYRDIHGI